jgi:hypothetical protein
LDVRQQSDVSGSLVHDFHDFRQAHFAHLRKYECKNILSWVNSGQTTRDWLYEGWIALPTGCWLLKTGLALTGLKFNLLFWFGYIWAYVYSVESLENKTSIDAAMNCGKPRTSGC